MDGATYSATIQSYGGGVGRNIAEGLSKLYGNSTIISAMGDDQNGLFLKSYFPKNCQTILKADAKCATANCSVILDKFGECKLCAGNMEIHSTITSEFILQHEKRISNAPIIILDGNISLLAMKTILNICQKYNKPVFFEPTDMRIAHKPFTIDGNLQGVIKFISPNLYELRAIANALGFIESRVYVPPIDELSTTELFQEVQKLSQFVGKTVENVIVTLGPFGVMIARRGRVDKRFFNNVGNYSGLNDLDDPFEGRYYKADQVDEIVNVSGAGDSFISGFITGMLKGKSEDVCVRIGFEAASKALKSSGAVPKVYFDETDKCWSTSASFDKMW